MKNGAANTIDKNSSEAIYEQVKYYIQLEIAAGRFHPNVPLPSVRVLAETLNVNASSVGMAFRHLELTNIVLNRRGKTAQVTKSGMNRCKKIVQERVHQNLAKAIAHCKTSGCSDKEIRDMVAQALKQNASR